MTDDDLSHADPAAEITAMQGVSNALKDLSPESIDRVLAWARSAYLGKIETQRFGTPATNVLQDEAEKPANSATEKALEFSSFAELFETTAPSTEADRVLVAGYWFQEVSGESDIDAYSVNSELKHLGHPAGNITRAFDTLIKQRPALVMQVRKSGSSKQARKRYRLTNEGLKAVRRMIAGETE